MAFTAQQIKDYVESVKFDPVAIAQTAGKFNVSMDDIASAMGYDTEQVLNYLKDGLQNAGMGVYFEGGEQQGESGSTYTPITISSFSKPVEGSKQKYEAFGPDMQSRGIIDNGSLASQILRDLSPLITMAVPFAGAELASLLGVSTATGTALVNAGMQVAQGGDAKSVLTGLVSSQLSQAISPVVASELQDIVSNPTTSKLITNIGTSVVNSALTGNTSNLGKTILGSAVDTLVGTQTGNSTLGNVLGSAVTGGGQGAANTLAGIVGSTGSSGSTGSTGSTELIPTLDTYPETDDDLISILANKSGKSSITTPTDTPTDTPTPTPTPTDTQSLLNILSSSGNSSIPTDTQSLLNILGDSSNQIIGDAPFVAAPDTQVTTPDTQVAAQRIPPDYSKRSFNSAFAAARLLGEPDFTWKGQTFTTQLAPSNTNRVLSANQTPNVSDVYPDIKGTAADKAKTTQTTAENLGPYISYKNAFGMTPQMGDINQVADPRTLAFTKGFLGDYTSDKGFSVLHPDISGIKNAGDVGTYSGVGAQLAPLVGPISTLLGSGVKTLGSTADESFASLLGKNANKDYMAANLDQYATEPARFGPNSPVWSSFIDDVAKNPGTTNAEINQLLQKANDAAKSGNAAESYRIMQNDPYTRNLMLDFSKNIGFQEVGPAKATRSFFAGPDVNPLAQYQTNPGSYPQFMTNMEGEFVSNQNYRQPYAWGLPSALERAKTPTLGHGWYNDVKSQPRPKRMIGEKAATRYAAGGLAGGGLTEDKAKALADAYAAGDISMVNQLLSSGITAEDIKSLWGFTDEDIAGLTNLGIQFGQPSNTSNDDLLDIVNPPADNITSTGYVKPSTRPTGGGVSNVIEGDDIETQIAQLPQEYASWRSSVVPGYSDFIRKSDGAVLSRTKNNSFSDLDLLKIGLSFIPGAGPILAAINIAGAVKSGDWVQAAIGATGFVPGMQNLNTALKVGQAIGNDNIFGAFTALAGNTDLQKLVGFDTTNLGGFTVKDATAASQLLQAANSNNYAAFLTHLGTLTNSSDTALAGRALSLLNRINNGDIKALTEAVGFSNSIMSGSSSTSGSTGDSGSNITTLTKEEQDELNPGELNAYNTGGIDGLVTFRRDMRLLGTLTNTGYTGVDDTKGTNTTDTTGTGGTGSTVNVVGKTDTNTTTNCGAGRHFDAILNTCVDDEVIKTKTPLVCDDGFAPNEAGTACIPTVTVTACGPGKVRNAAGNCVDIDCGVGRHFDALLNTCVDDEVIKPTLNCAEGYKPNEAGTECIPTVTVTACGEGKVRDPVTGECVFPTTTPTELNCADGYEPDETGTKCIPTVVITACGEGKVRDPVTGECVFPNVDKPCDDGFHKDDTGLCVPDEEDPCDDGYHRVNGACVLKDCAAGYVRNLETGLCEKVQTACPAGQTRNAAGNCVPIVVTPPVVCQPGYEKVNNVCVPICQTGYVRVNGVCQKIPTDTIVPTSALSVSSDKTEPIYAGGMDDFDMFATLNELLAGDGSKKTPQETQQTTKMATGGHLDDLLAEQMTVDDLLKLLR